MTDDDVSWLQSLLESRRPDPGPVVGRWALGIGDMVADHPLTPEALAAALIDSAAGGAESVAREIVRLADEAATGPLRDDLAALVVTLDDRLS